MPELETKKYSTDELRPLLSLKQTENQQDDEKIRQEQEALWNRSLEFFQKMKKNNAQHA